MSGLPDDYEARLAVLEDPTLKRVAILGLEGLDVIDIAGLLGVTQVYVRRRLQIIRLIWAEKWSPPDFGQPDGLPR